MAEKSIQVANDVVTQALEEVYRYTAKIKKIEDEIDKIKEKIKKIKEEIEAIGPSAESPETDRMHKTLQERLKNETDCLKDEKDALKEASDRLEKAKDFYLQLRPEERSTLEQSIGEMRTLSVIRKAISTPSSFGKFTGEGCWRNFLKDFGEQVDCHRTSMESNSLPITLMHRVFAEFVQNCQSITLSNESCTFAHVLCRTMLEDYKKEKEMAQAARALLKQFLKVDIMVLSTHRSQSDGSYRLNEHLILNLEVKTQSGSRSDPSMQNVAYFLEHLPDAISRQLPCLLLDLSGPLLGIYGAMNTDDKHMICEPLCPILPLHNVDNALVRPFVSRVCAALQIAVKSLEKVASTVDSTGLSTFPYKTSIQIDGARVKFRYLQRVERYVFLVECTGADESVYKAIAKFTKGYGREVHEYCAKNGFAPKLLAYEELAASWSFVLMEHVVLESISGMDSNEKRQQLDNILQSLRIGNFVHGDLRQNNVFWNRDQNRVILIDFDWSGINGEKRYPCNMNPEVQWPDGASTGELLSFDHDAYWINKI